MQKKPALIIAAIAVVGICAFLFIRSKYLVKPTDTEVITFLDSFNTDVNAGNPDTLLKYFDSPKKAKQLNRLLNLLCNKMGSDGGKPLFYVSLDTHQSEIKLINAEILDATVPVQFTEKVNSGNIKQTSLLLRLRKVSAGVFRIVRIDAREFVKDYIAYERKINPDKKITPAYYSPITLAAFKTAEQLKNRYDSVLWFQHVNNQTYFYVIKGKWNYQILNDYNDAPTEKPIAKMGLVNPDLKEIIPAEYDLIHNIGGTIDGLIEVEKGTKRGLFDLTGKNVVAVDYDQILPLQEGEDLAILRNGDDYFYLKKDLSITTKLSDFKIADALPKIKSFNSSYTLSDSTSKDIMEDNARDSFTSTIISPSYLVDWKIMPKLLSFRNPLRKSGDNPDEMEEEEGSGYYQITFDGYTEKNNWLASAFYSLVDDYLGGRSGLYQTKSVLLVDRNKNRVLSYEATTYFGQGEGGSPLSGRCNNDYLRAINDTLFEYRTTCRPEQLLHDNSTLDEAPHYYYLHVNKGKLEALPNRRLFGFTKYVKMNDSYLNSCYVINDNAIDHTTSEILRYMKNEIYGQYHYTFKDPQWTKVFQQRFYFDEEKQVNINDSLTVIDKYNINFIDQKLKGIKTPAKVLAAR